MLFIHSLIHSFIHSFIRIHSSRDEKERSRSPGSDGDYDEEDEYRSDEEEEDEAYNRRNKEGESLSSGDLGKPQKKSFFLVVRPLRRGGG